MYGDGRPDASGMDEGDVGEGDVMRTLTLTLTKARPMFQGMDSVLDWTGLGGDAYGLL